MLYICLDLDGVMRDRIAWHDHMYGVKSKFIDVRRVVCVMSFLVSNVKQATKQVILLPIPIKSMLSAVSVRFRFPVFMF